MRAISHLERQALAQRAAVGQRALRPDVRTLPAPSGGWNARDSWDAMDPEDAIELENWYPGHGQVTVRRGYQLWEEITAQSSSPVETLAVYSGTAGEKMAAVAGGKWYDVTTGTASELKATTFNTSRWQWAVMNDKLAACSGQDKPQVWEGGSSISNLSVSGPSDTSLLVGVNVYKSRSYFWEAGTQDFWYSAVNTLGGTLTKFPLADVGSFGGELTAMATWTRDGGSGSDDYAVFFMSSGEVIVYQGSDPGNSNDWSLVGVFRIGALLGRRAFAKAGGDLMIATQDGYQTLSDALPGGRMARGTRMTDKIAPAVQERVRSGGDSFGWQLFHYPRGRRLIANHPRGASFQQHVVNLETGAWCRFTGIGARCWALFDNRPFFGGADGKVYEADQGQSDAGTEITANGKQAFNYLGTRQTNKHVHMVRPLLDSGESVTARIGLAADFSPTPQATIDVTYPLQDQASGKWGTAKWGEARWGAPTQTVSIWSPHVARGYAISPSVRVDQSDRPITWSGTNVAFNRAGPV